MVRARARTIPTPETPGGAAKFLAEASGLSELDVTRTASLIMVDSYIDEGGVLQIRTGLPEDNFRLVNAALFNSMDEDPNSPLYWGKKGAESSAGRRCSVAPRHMLFLYFEHKRHGMSQDYVASVYKISQTAISRYFEYIEQWMSNLLPTADRISEELQNARTEDQIQRVFNKLLRRLEKIAGFKLGSAGDPGPTLPGNIAITDGVELRVQRPTDKDERDACYSGKKKDTTRKSDAISNAKGALLGHSDLAPGSTHDLTLLRESEPDLGLITRCMKGESAAMQIIEFVDKGFRGLDKHHPGSKIMMPLPRAQSGTKKARAHNHRVNTKRVQIENTFRKVETFAWVRNRGRKIEGKFRRGLDVITGVVNLAIMTSGNREPRTHRKGKKPGPKTARSR